MFDISTFKNLFDFQISGSNKYVEWFDEIRRLQNITFFN